MRLLSKIAVALGGLAVMGMASSEARANSVEISFVGSSGGVFTYDARLTENNEVVAAGDVVYFYDFAGFTGGFFTPSASLAAAGGTYVFQEYTENDTLSPGVDSKRVDIAPGDDAAIAEVRFSYAGLTFQNLLGSGGSVDLGTFTLTSAYTNTADSWTQSTDTQLVPVISNINVRPTTVAAVPLPAAAWGGMALFGVLGGAKLRRSRKALA